MANQNRKLKNSRKHQNRKIPTPPNSPREPRKVVSTLEVDVALDHSPNNKRTSLEIRINENYPSNEKITQNVQIESISDCAKSFEDQTDTITGEKLPPIPTLSIVVEECRMIPENVEGEEDAIQAEVHNLDNGNNLIEQDENEPEQSLFIGENCSAHKKDYLKIPSIFYG